MTYTLVILKKSIPCTFHKHCIWSLLFSVFVRDTINSTVVVACGQFRVRDCASLKISLFCSTQPVIESSRELQFSCYQFYYNQLAGKYLLVNTFCIGTYQKKYKNNRCNRYRLPYLYHQYDNGSSSSVIHIYCNICN